MPYAFPSSCVCGEYAYPFGWVDKSEFLSPFYSFYILAPGTNLSNPWGALFRTVMTGFQMDPWLSQTVRALSVPSEGGSEFRNTQCQVINTGFIQSENLLSSIKCAREEDLVP